MGRPRSYQAFEGGISGGRGAKAEAADLFRLHLRLGHAREPLDALRDLIWMSPGCVVIMAEDPYLARAMAFRASVLHHFNRLAAEHYGELASDARFAPRMWEA